MLYYCLIDRLENLYQDSWLLTGIQTISEFFTFNHMTICWILHFRFSNEGQVKQNDYHRDPKTQIYKSVKINSLLINIAFMMLMCQHKLTIDVAPCFAGFTSQSISGWHFT
jgi:hypothetical protein